MKWVKKGLIYAPTARGDWSQSHAQVPLADKVGEDTLRIYFGTRDSRNRTVTTFIEVEADNPSNVLYLHDRPVLGLGPLGCFDDSGAMPSWIVYRDGVKYLYYTGWNVSTTVPYRNSVGVAISNDGGQTFTRMFAGPILERTHLEPHLCATPCVLEESGIWRMWYLSCVDWEVIAGKPEPRYHIKYAESEDGILWRRRGLVAIDFASATEGALARPSVIRQGGLYRMWYSRRSIHDYRSRGRGSYRIGYAESADGIDWERKDECVGIDVSDEGWDSEMIAYPFVYEHKGELHLLYNGNGFGATGFGHAILA